jgi:hypothetical protein
MNDMPESSFYYYSFLKKDPQHLDYLHSELEKRVYYYGEHFKASYESEQFLSYWLIFFLEIGLFAFNKLKYGRKKPDRRSKVLSNCYFGFNSKLEGEGFDSRSVPWESSRQQSVCSLKDFLRIQLFKHKLRKYNFNRLLSAAFASEIDDIQDVLENMYAKARVKAIFLSNDVGFFERLTIDIAKKKGIKTFILMHGAAPRYINTWMDNRTDYLLVFGHTFQERYARSGINKDKIIVVGHPRYSTMVESVKPLRFGLEDVLVISKTIPGQPMQIKEGVIGRSGDTMRISDRGNSILYLNLLQESLQKFGVTQVRLRIHPSESEDWYKRFLDLSFFRFDAEPIVISLKAASLIIGPTSSTFLDAIFYGVNYLVFEPVYEDGLDVLNKGIGYPFDGTEEKIPAAKSIEKLEEILSSKKCIDTSILEEFISPKFSLDKVSDILKEI